MVTKYKGMIVYANSDKMKCGFDIAVKEGFWLTAELEDKYNHIETKKNNFFSSCRRL